MNILVISPHPDDETLGAGGTLLKFKEQGNKIYWINITNVSEKYGYPSQVVYKRKLQIEEVKNKYQFDGFYDLGLRPANLESYNSSEIIQQLSKIIEEIKPNTIILPNRSDVHSDHKIVFDWSYSCSKIFRAPYIHTILSMEILSETEFGLIDDFFVPNYFVDITNYLEEKSKILKIYQSEVGEHPFPRSSEGIASLAMYRGISAGTKYAEAFKIIKMIHK